MANANTDALSRLHVEVNRKKCVGQEKRGGGENVTG